MSSHTWSSEDETIVKTKVEEYLTASKTIKWKIIGQLLSIERTSEAVRERYINYIDENNLNKQPFTKDEDIALLKLCKLHANRWTFISTKMPGRSPGFIKNYCNSQKFKQLNPSYFVPTSSASKNSSSSSSVLAVGTAVQAKWGNTIYAGTVEKIYANGDYDIGFSIDDSIARVGACDVHAVQGPQTSSSSSLLSSSSLSVSQSFHDDGMSWYGIGDIVRVQRREGVGVGYKPGGQGKIVGVDGKGSETTYRVKYSVARTTEKNLPATLLQMVPPSSSSSSSSSTTSTVGDKRHLDSPSSSPGRQRQQERNSNKITHDANRRYIITDKHPSELLNFDADNTKPPPQLVRFNLGWEEHFKVVARTSSSNLIITSNTGRSRSTYLISPSKFQDGDGTTAEQLSFGSEARILQFAERAHEANAIADRQQKIQQDRVAFETRVQEAIQRGATDNDPDIYMEVDSAPAELSTVVAAELASAIVGCTQQLGDLVSTLVGQLALQNGGRITLQRFKTGIKCASLGLNKLGGCADDGFINDEDDDGTKPAFIFRDVICYHLYRVLPQNVPKYVKEIKDMNIQTYQHRNQEHKLRKHATTTTTDGSKAWFQNDMDDLTSAQKQGSFNATNVNASESMEHSVAAGGMAAIMQRKHHLQAQQQANIKRIVSEKIDEITKETEKDKKMVLLVEKEAVIRCAEQAFHEFIYNGGKNPELMVELVERIKLVAPNLWLTQSVLGHCERDNRNKMATPSQKDRKILVLWLSNICAGNQNVLQSFRIFMSMVRTNDGVSLAELDRLASAGLCARQQPTIDYMNSLLPGAEVKYTKYSDILIDNANLSRTVGFQSTLDGAQNKIDNTTVGLVRTQLADNNILKLEESYTIPSLLQIKNFLDTAPFNIDTAKSKASVPEAHPHWHLYPLKLREMIEKEEGPLNYVQETAAARAGVMVANSLLDTFMDFLRITTSSSVAEYSSLSLTPSELVELDALHRLLTECHSVSTLGYAGSNPTKNRVRSTSLEFAHRCVMDENEMSTGGLSNVLRAMASKIDISFTKAALEECFRTKTFENTLQFSMDVGTLTTLESVLVRSLVGMKSKDASLAWYCAINVFICLSATSVGDQTHEIWIHGCACIFSLKFGSGLQPLIRAIAAKSINPNRVIQKCQRHGVILKQIRDMRAWVAFVDLLRRDELRQCFVEKDTNGTNFTFVDSIKLMSLLKDQLTDGGPSLVLQGWSLLEEISMYVEAKAGMRSYDMTSVSTFRLYSLAQHRILGKRYYGKSMDQITNYHFSSPYSQHVVMNESLLAIKGNSSAAVDKGDRVENNVGQAKKEKGWKNQNRRLGSLGMMERCADAVYTLPSSETRPPATHTKTPSQHKQCNRLLGVFIQSGVTIRGNVSGVEEGVGNMWVVSEAFMKHDAEEKDRKKRDTKALEEEEMSAVNAGGTKSTSGTEEPIAMDVFGIATAQQVNTYSSQLSTMGAGSHDGAWEVKVKKAPEEKTKINKKYTNFRQNFNATAQAEARKKQLRKYKLRLHAIHEAFDCFLTNHCNNNTVGNVPSSSIKIQINSEVLQNLSPEDFTEEDIELCDLIDAETKAGVADEAEWVEMEWIGS